MGDFKFSMHRRPQPSVGCLIDDFEHQVSQLSASSCELHKQWATMMLLYMPMNHDQQVRWWLLCLRLREPVFGVAG